MGLTRLVTGAVFHLETVRENQFPCLLKLLEAASFLNSRPLPPSAKPEMLGRFLLVLPSL